MVLGKFKDAMMSQFKQQDTSQKVPFDDEIAKFVEDEYQQRRETRLPFELQWRLNAEFLSGNQYLDIDPSSLSIQEIPKLSWHQEREVFNQLAPIHETRVAQLSRTSPLLKVRPASQDDGDIGAAKVSSSLLQARWHEENMDVLWDDLCSWTEQTGTAFIKSIWNKDKGKTVYTEQVPKQKKEEPELKNGDTDQVVEMLSTDYENVDTKEGDIETCVVSPYEIFPDNNYATSIEALNSIIHARAYHIKDIDEIWGVQVEPEKVDVLTQQQMQSGLGGIGYSVGGFRGKASQMQNHAIVKEYYERPSKKYAEGRFIVVAHNKTLHVGPLPYKVGTDDKYDFPFSIARSIKKPGGHFWGVSVVERLIPIQRRYNALRNRKAEYLNRVVIGQWYEPEGSLTDDSELNDEPGNVIRYRPTAGQKPEPVVQPGLPQEFETEVQTLLSEFTAISGVSELSRYSQAPPGVKSGVALSIANEQDNTRISNTASNLAQCIKLMGQQWLRLYKQFAQEPRVLRIAGRERDVEVMHWTASMLRSDDVVIENSSALAETPAQRRQMVFDMLNAGLFMKEEMSQISESSKRKIFEMLEYGNWEESMMEVSRLQEQKAKRENMKMKKGEQVALNEYDDDEIHVEMHNRLRISAEYEDAITQPGGETLDQIMTQHIAEHNQRSQEQAQAVVDQEMAQLKAQQTIENEGKAHLQELVNAGRIQSQEVANEGKLESQEVANEGKLQSQELANEAKDNQPKQPKQT